MTRAGFRAGAAALVVVLLAGLGWLFLAPQDATTQEEDSGKVVRKPAGESGEEAEARVAATSRSTSPGTKAGVDPGPVEESAHKGPKANAVTGVCALEDGTPLAGAEVEDSEDDPLLGTRDEKVLGIWGSTKTGADGMFEFTPGSRVRAHHPFARAVAVEGAEGEIGDRGAFVRTGPETTGLRILFRDDPGMAHVRLVDSSTEEPLTSVKGMRLTYLFGRELSGRAVYDFPEDLGFGGWIYVREGALPEGLGVEAEPAGVVVEFAASGYAPKRVPLPEIRGRMQLRVDPVPPCVIGAISGESVDAPIDRITATLHPQEGRPAVDTTGVRGLPTSTGFFRLDDLPRGTWVLEVALAKRTTVLRARRSFEYAGETVDLGDIAFAQGAAVRARAVDSAGEPVPQARVVVVREGEDPEKARVMAAGDDGWVAYSDLEPNLGHRVVALGMPRELEKPVRTAADGKPVDVELSWPEKLVPCRITLVVDGKAVANADGSRTIPATVHESPLPRDQGAWHADGTFAAKLVPGTYRFSAWATPEGGGDLALFGAEVTVPSGDSFETRLELVRETR